MKINKFNSRKKWADFVWAKLLSDIKNPTLGNILDFLLTSYEKNIIVNRLTALSLIKKGKTYKQIEEELWLSPNTIRSLKIILEDNSNKYQSCRFLRNKKIQARKTKIKIPESHPIIDWIDYCVSVFPQKHGPRWKAYR